MVAPDGQAAVVRFTNKKNKASLATRSFKSAAFAPTFHRGRWELSVLLREDREDDEVWAWGRDVVGEVFGWVELSAAEYNALGLTIVRDDEPKPGHANVLDWPEDRAEQLDLRQRLAALTVDKLVTAT